MLVILKQLIPLDSRSRLLKKIHIRQGQYNVYIPLQIQVEDNRKQYSV